MAGELEAVVKELEAVDREIHDLEKTLEKARQRKVHLQNERSKIEKLIKENEFKPSTPAAGGAPPGETPEELQARIAELQKQIELKKTAELQRKAETRSRSRSRSRTQSPAKRSTKSADPSTATAPAEAAPAKAAPAKAAPAKADDKKKSWGLFGRSGKNKGDPSTGDEAHATLAASPPAPDPPAPDPPARPIPQPNPEPPVTSPGSRSKSQWERPGWATNMDIQDDRAVLSDPIKEGALKEQSGGYRRQVFEKDLELQKGKFVKPSAKKIEPRLTWIVLRINDTGVPGKVVMHLYGKDVHNLVDHFVNLKDTTVVVGGPNKASLTVQSDPPLYISVMGAQGLDNKPGVYGVVQEGKEIVDKVVNVAGATLTIKQAHIFPVKKSK